MSAREEGADDRELAYCATLALARMDDTSMALVLYENAGLGDSDDDDMLALRGRLMKDLAEKADSTGQPGLFANASAAYRAIYEHSGGYFPAINAATTALLAGDDETAKSLAAEILRIDEICEPGDYYAAATAAEAHLLLEQDSQAFEAMAAAVNWPDAGIGSRASTFRQMMLIGEILPDRAESVAPLLELLRPAPVLFYTGRMFREDEEAEAGLRGRIETALDDLQPDVAYGALACGADILIAEAVLARGLELNLLFPFQLEDFIAQSVLPGGKGWIERFNACLDGATRISFATEMGYIGDPGMFRYGSTVAMGLARMRAEHLRTDAVQLAIIEQGENGAGPAGTASDVAMWRDLGHRAVIVDPGPIDRKLDAPESVEMPRDV
ncbi:MAG: adenylate cyclase, partial [Sphingomonadaceae bacterium]|nr:adenylate cyclase [Sphingomonadaceae bacterium]